jgi:lipopolysaccharide/colanic/teichoic acid biosynthesis glycosyltransferase
MKSQSIRYWILAADLLWILAALLLSIYVRFANVANAVASGQHLENYFLMVLAANIAWTALYLEMGLDGFKGGWHFPAILSKVIVAVSLLMTVVFAVAFLTQHNYSRLVLLYFTVFFTAGLLCIRSLSRSIVSAHLSGAEDNRCLILGSGALARELASKIASHPELPFKIVGFLFPGEPEALNGLSKSLGKPVGAIKTLQVLELMAQHGVRKLIIAMGQPNNAEIRKLIGECRKNLIQVYLVPQLYDLYLSRAKLIEIDSLPLLSLEERNPAPAKLTLKRALDLLLSCGILILVSPLLAASAFVVYAKKGRAFRAEARCGKDGIPFPMYRLNIERHATNPAYFERLFVRWSLTELPQLWNVVRGEMSLVGPRPETPERVKNYSEWQRQRLKVSAGVTGLAQVHGLRDQHSSDDKTRFDLQYIFNSSPLVDLGLILQTIWTLLSRGLNHESTPSDAVAVRSSAGDLLTQEVGDVNRT